MEWSSTMGGKLCFGETKDIEVPHIALETNTHPDVVQLVFKGLCIGKQYAGQG